MSAPYVYTFWAAKKNKDSPKAVFAHQTIALLALFNYFFMFIVEKLFNELAEKLLQQLFFFLVKMVA